jgi:hypothetical protein
MNVLDLLQGPAVIVLVPVLMLAILRVIAPEGVDLDEILRLSPDQDWPRGRQEDEPVRWRVELLSRRADQPATVPTDHRTPAKAPVRT